MAVIRSATCDEFTVRVQNGNGGHVRHCIECSIVNLRYGCGNDDVAGQACLTEAVCADVGQAARQIDCRQRRSVAECFLAERGDRVGKLNALQLRGAVCKLLGKHIAVVQNNIVVDDDLFEHRECEYSLAQLNLEAFARVLHAYRLDPRVVAQDRYAVVIEIAELDNIFAVELLRNYQRAVFACFVYTGDAGDVFAVHSIRNGLISGIGRKNNIALLYGIFTVRDAEQQSAILRSVDRDLEFIVCSCTCGAVCIVNSACEFTGLLSGKIHCILIFADSYFHDRRFGILLVKVEVVELDKQGQSGVVLISNCPNRADRACCNSTFAFEEVIITRVVVFKDSLTDREDTADGLCLCDFFPIQCGNLFICGIVAARACNILFPAFFAGRRSFTVMVDQIMSERGNGFLRGQDFAAYGANRACGQPCFGAGRRFCVHSNGLVAERLNNFLLHDFFSANGAVRAFGQAGLGATCGHSGIHNHNVLRLGKSVFDQAHHDRGDLCTGCPVLRIQIELAFLGVAGNDSDRNRPLQGLDSPFQNLRAVCKFSKVFAGGRMIIKKCHIAHHESSELLTRHRVAGLELIISHAGSNFVLNCPQDSVIIPSAGLDIRERILGFDFGLFAVPCFQVMIVQYLYDHRTSHGCVGLECRLRGAAEQLILICVFYGVIIPFSCLDVRERQFPSSNRNHNGAQQHQNAEENCEDTLFHVIASFNIGSLPL